MLSAQPRKGTSVHSRLFPRFLRGFHEKDTKKVNSKPFRQWRHKVDKERWVVTWLRSQVAWVLVLVLMKTHCVAGFCATGSWVYHLYLRNLDRLFLSSKILFQEYSEIPNWYEKSLNTTKRRWKSSMSLVWSDLPMLQASMEHFLRVGNFLPSRSQVSNMQPLPSTHIGWCEGYFCMQVSEKSLARSGLQLSVKVA